MKTYKLLLALAGILFVTGISAQGFASFSVGDSKGVIRHIRNKPSQVDVLVDKQVDLSQVDFDYKLLGGCSLEKELTSDFRMPQNVIVHKNDGSLKEWVITLKKLIPASLPLNLSFSKANPAIWNMDAKGWVNCATDESKPMVVRFGNSNVSFVVAYEGEASEVSFDLSSVIKNNAAFDGVFVVETSNDGVVWRKLKGFKDKKITANSHFKCSLEPSVRFIRWVYQERVKMNINLNNIQVK